MEREFAHPAFYTRDDVAEVTKQYEARKRRLDKLEAQWTEAVQEVEAEAARH